MSSRLRTAVAGCVFSQQGPVERSWSGPAKRDVLHRLARQDRLLLHALTAPDEGLFAPQHMDDMLPHRAGSVGEAGRGGKSKDQAHDPPALGPPRRSHASRQGA